MLGATFSQSYSRSLYLENGRSRTDGPGGFVSASVNVGNLFTIGGSLQYAAFDNSLFRTIQGFPSAAKYDAQNLSGSVFVNKFVSINDVIYVLPTVRLLI